MDTSTTIKNLRQHCGPHAADVMRITGLSEYDLSLQIGEEGWRYIARQACLNAAMAERFNVSRIFWNWFKMNWYSHDADFVARYGQASIEPVLYLEYHRIRMSSIYPDRVLVNAILNAKPKKEATV